MTQDASARLRRLLSVIPLFAEAECISREELERRSGVQLSSLLDDLRALTERSDTPGGFVEDLRVEIERDRVSIHSSHFKRPMRITVPELCALELGLAMLASSSPREERGAIDRARRKLRKAIVEMPAPDVGTWQAIAPTAGDGTTVAALHEAAMSSRKVRIVYHAGAAAAPTTRVIHPYALVPSHGTWYVIAHCERADGLRSFRADRIQSLERLDETFARPEALPRAIQELLEKEKPYHSEPDETLAIRYSPRIARWIAEREGLPLDADGSLIVRHPLGDDHWAVGRVLQYGPDAEVLSPSRIREQVKGVLEAMLA